jgi:hypothetical protein
MRALKRWIRNWLDNDGPPYAIAQESPLHQADGHIDTYQNKSITFTLNRAIGGAVIQSRIYNRTTDDNQVTLYIINDDQEFNEAFSQIVSLEYMKI